MKSSPKPKVKLALVVHSDLSVLSKFQEAFKQAGMTTLLARDLATALVALSQNNFEVAIISWRITESGDGWALGATLRRIFPSAFVVVLANETSVPTLKEAINQGFDQLYDSSRSPEEVAAEIVVHCSRRPVNDVVQ
jgi:DNA-binding response OmpR family regulator